MAKTFDDLFPALVDFTNLHAAWEKAAQGKRRRLGAANFVWNLMDELIRLQDELSSETWQPGAYYSFYIRDPKRSLVSAAPFRDRVLIDDSL